MTRPALIVALLASLVTASVAGAQSVDGGYEDEFPTTLTPAAAETMFRAELQRLWGAAWEQADSQWVRCPEEGFADGWWDEEELVYWPAWQLCEARFNIGRTWRATTMVVRDSPTGPALDEETYTGTWRRQWRNLGRSCKVAGDPRGTVSVNTQGCPYMLVGDLAYDLTSKRRLSPRYYSRGTNKAGFGDVYIWRCTIKRPTIRCANKLGDAYKYTPSAGLRRRLGWN